jgi:AbrB family looped-hinge helix DNA binding protein
MSTLATTKMSSKGQIVIPEAIRKSLRLHAGSQFLVLGDDGVVILKFIAAPSPKEFNKLIAKARKQARQAGLKRADIAASVAKVRKSK